MPIGTVPELVEVARRLAAEAVGLYRGLAERMADLGNESARAAFAALEAEQRRHAAALEKSVPPELRTPPAPTRRWAEMAVFDDEDLGRTRLATPYRALSVAVRNEERAFDFWSYVSAQTRSPEVRREAERLALDELTHVRDLRQARRRAYHAERHGHPRDRAERLLNASRAEFLREAAREEQVLAELHDAIARKLRQVGHADAGELAAIAAEEASSARELAPGGRETAVQPGSEMALPAEPRALLSLASERLEAELELLLALGERSQDSEVVAEAQRLSHVAVGRLSRLNRMTAEMPTA